MDWLDKLLKNYPDKTLLLISAYGMGIIYSFIQYKLYGIDIQISFSLNDVLLSGIVYGLIFLLSFFVCYLLYSFVDVTINTLIQIQRIWWNKDERRKIEKAALGKRSVLQIFFAHLINGIVISWYIIVHPNFFANIMLSVSLLFFIALQFYKYASSAKDKIAKEMLIQLGYMLMVVGLTFFVGQIFKQEHVRLLNRGYTKIELYEGNRLIYKSPDSVYYIGETPSHIYLLEYENLLKRVIINKKNVTIEKISQ